MTGLLYLSAGARDLHGQMETVDEPLVDLPFEQLCPGSAELEKLQARFR